MQLDSGDSTLPRSCRRLQRRLRGLESFIQTREKMAALGTLSAGLAHELNNPAAALVRALKNVPDALIELQRMNLVYGQRNVDAAHTQKWLKVRDAGYDTLMNHRLDAVTLSEREDQILEWLEAYGVDNAWKLAEPLAVGGVEGKTLSELMEPWRNDPTELRDMGLRWLALSFDVMDMIASGLRGAERIAELVQSMKSYSYLDRGAQQIVDIIRAFSRSALNLERQPSPFAYQLPLKGCHRYLILKKRINLGKSNLVPRDNSLNALPLLLKYSVRGRFYKKPRSPLKPYRAKA